MIEKNAFESVMLAQVASVQAYSGAPANPTAVQAVAGGSLRVIETLAGPPVTGILWIVNPPLRYLQLPDTKSQPPAVTGVLRKGELWVVFVDRPGRRVDQRIFDPCGDCVSPLCCVDAAARRRQGAGRDEACCGKLQELAER